MDRERVVCIVLMDVQGSFLLQRRTASAAIAPGLWVFPGGHIEDGETPVAAARRELQEETNVRVASLRPVLVGTERLRDSSGRIRLLDFTVFAGLMPANAQLVLGEGDELRMVVADRLATYPLGPLAARINAALAAWFAAPLRGLPEAILLR